MARNRYRRGGARRWLRALADLLGDGLRGLIRLTLLVGALGGLGYAGWHAVLRSPYFHVRTVEVDATPHLSRDQIVTTVGLAGPRNIFRFDEGAAAEALRAHPWVARAEVRKALPSRVTIDLEERRPEGVVVLDELYLVDGTGQPFVRPTPDEALGHPLVTGLTRDAYEADPVGARERIRGALALARLYRQSPLSAQRRLSAVHLGEGGRSELHLERTRVVLGVDGFKAKLLRLERIFVELQSRNMDADYILLSEDGRRAIVKERTVRREMQGSLSLVPSDNGPEGVSN